MLRDKGNAVATINSKLRNLRLAFNTAISLNYMAVNPLKGWTWEKQPKREIRILKPDEKTKLVDAAESLYGFRMVSFVRFLFTTWPRFA